MAQRKERGVSALKEPGTGASNVVVRPNLSADVEHIVEVDISLSQAD